MTSGIERQLNSFKTRKGTEVSLFRTISEAEYISILKNGYKFITYPYAMEKKWFAISYKHAKLWSEILYPKEPYKIIEITVLDDALKFMFYVGFLDNIGPAYAADVDLLNAIVRNVRKT